MLRACDELAEQGLPVMAGGVSVLLGAERVAGSALVELVKWRRRKFGASTEAFVASMQSFEAFTNERRGDASTLKFMNVTATATDFRWVAAVTPFLDMLASLNAARPLGTLCVTADYTFGLCHMGFAYALINAVVWRRLGGRNRRSAWPLVVMCSPKERNMCYKEGFEALLGELARRELPVPATLIGSHHWLRHGEECLAPQRYRARSTCAVRSCGISSKDLQMPPLLHYIFGHWHQQLL